MQVIKRNGEVQDFDPEKIFSSIRKAYESTNEEIPEWLEETCPEMLKLILGRKKKNIQVEEIQDRVEKFLMTNAPQKVARVFIIYREKHKELREIKNKERYIEEYVSNGKNASTSSILDSNANIQNKNVATLESEIYKSQNVELSRYRVIKMLKKLYPENTPDYQRDLDSKVIYKHDESSAPAIKPYCVAVNMYPFFLKGTKSLDKLNLLPPNNTNSFVGQFGNLVFLLSSQFQGAIAFGEFFNVVNYYCVKEFGVDYYLKDDDVIYITENRKRTILDSIIQMFQGIVCTINQPAGNRSYQSPFTNISYYDKNYWEALFEDFSYPDGTKPKWEAVDYLQKQFMRWFNEYRTKTLLTFPVETIAMLSDGKDIVDKDYKDFVAEMYAKGHSFFTYISDNADSLSSCCRLKNKLDKTEFSFTNGLTGVATGSKSVITLNLNRIIQNFIKESLFVKDRYDKRQLSRYLSDILDRVYKYHHAYNELLWSLCDKGMMPVYSEGYISLNQQFLTVGINGLNEAAEFLGIEVSDNEKYEKFCNTIISTINEQNRKHEVLSGPHHLKFNTEFVPAESLAIKNYNWDKQDGYWVPNDRNLYNSYFYKPDDKTISVLEKFKLHGKRYVDNLDGGVALHCNLEDHLSKEQYLRLIEFAVKEGTNYFTFNIPNSECEECGHIVKKPITKCPMCEGEKITQWTRIIGYLRPIKAFSEGRQIEEKRRIYKKTIDA